MAFEQDEVKQVKEGFKDHKAEHNRGMDKWQDGRDADLIRFGFQGVCGTGTLQMLVLLCGDTHTHMTHKDINSWEKEG